MSKYTDPEHNDRLYGADGYAARCLECDRPADYLRRPDDDLPWTQATPWCLECWPRRGRRPHHGERYVRAALHRRQCAAANCEAPATTATTGTGDPHLSQVRRGLQLDRLEEILQRATPYCPEHAPTSLLGPHGAAAAHPFANADLLRAAIADERATSLTTIGRLLGVKDGGTTTRSLLRNHARHVENDPTFPALPEPRTQAEWGALAWAQRTVRD